MISNSIQLYLSAIAQNLVKDYDAFRIEENFRSLHPEALTTSFDSCVRMSVRPDCVAARLRVPTAILASARLQLEHYWFRGCVWTARTFHDEALHVREHAHYYYANNPQDHGDIRRYYESEVLLPKAQFTLELQIIHREPNLVTQAFIRPPALITSSGTPRPMAECLFQHANLLCDYYHMSPNGQFAFLSSQIRRHLFAGLTTAVTIDTIAAGLWV